MPTPESDQPEIEVDALIARWRRERRIGSIELHFKDGKILQADEKSVTRIGARPLLKRE